MTKTPTTYVVTMVRPEFEGSTVRTITLDEPAIVKSARQLAGYLTHLLFTREERGERANTYFTVEERTPTKLNVFTIVRDYDRHYAHS